MVVELPSPPADTYRCWICLDDQPTTAGMLSPCACVGTNKWVHESCLKTYCLEKLAANQQRQHDLSVYCPICRVPYMIERQCAGTAPWRELLRCTSTDRQLLLRHFRFGLLALPLLVASVLAWIWLVAYWEDLRRNGPGPPLMVGAAPEPTELGRLPKIHAALTWLPAQFTGLLTSVLDVAWGGTDADSPSGKDVHPANISRKWSTLYVWLQYVRWHKILAWVVMMLLGDVDGLLPTSAREYFRIEELVLASERRTQLFFFGQFMPFILSKLRHVFVSCFASVSSVARYVVYSLFSSHFEVALTVGCDTLVLFALLGDWLASVVGDFQLRLNLNRLRGGYFKIRSRNEHSD